MKVKKNPNEVAFAEISKAIEKNDGYCCCAIIKDGDSMCPCKDFKCLEETGACHCGRYYKIKEAKRIVICGSMKFKQIMKEVELMLVNKGYVVDMPFIEKHDDSITKLLDEQHLIKIEQADEIYVVNVGGYIGESTEKEIEWAQYLGKDITYYEPIKGE